MFEGGFWTVTDNCVICHKETTNQLTPLPFLSYSDIGSQQEKDSRTAKALDMSLRYSFVTPLTSMVVTKPETEDGPSGPLIADKLTEGKGNAAKSLLSVKLTRTISINSLENCSTKPDESVGLMIRAANTQLTLSLFHRPATECRETWRYND